MIDLVTDLYVSYGLVGMAITLAVAQFGLPLPTSIVLMSVGALLAASDLSALEAFGWAICGAVAGDQAGYLTGRLLGGRLERFAGRSDYIASGLSTTREFSRRWGRASVFLSRWLVSPAGPWINLTSGAAGMPWPAFTLWGLGGEAIWVAAYLTLGFLFSSYISGIAEMIANAGWAIGALVVTIFIGWRLWHRIAPASTDQGPENLDPGPA